MKITTLLKRLSEERESKSAFGIYEKDVVGSFIEKDTGNRFDIYRIPDTDTWGKKIGATHIIHPFGHYFSKQFPRDRYAIIKKTVVQVAVDEDDTGKPVWEKWQVRNLKMMG